MKKFVNKLTTAMNSAKVKVGYCSMVAASALTTVYARADEGTGESIVRTALDKVIGIFPWIGAFFIASGVFKLIMAYRGENPEAQTGAAKDIVIGAVLVIFDVFIWTAIDKAIWGNNFAG